MIDPTGALFNLFMLLVWDKKIGEVITLEGRDKEYNDVTFGKLTFTRNLWLSFTCSVALCKIDFEIGELRNFENAASFSYIDYIVNNKEETDEQN